MPLIWLLIKLTIFRKLALHLYKFKYCILLITLGYSGLNGPPQFCKYYCHLTPSNYICVTYIYTIFTSAQVQRESGNSADSNIASYILYLMYLIN